MTKKDEKSSLCNLNSIIENNIKLLKLPSSDSIKLILQDKEGNEKFKLQLQLFLSLASQDRNIINKMYPLIRNNIIKMHQLIKLLYPYLKNAPLEIGAMMKTILDYARELNNLKKIPLIDALLTLDHFMLMRSLNLYYNNDKVSKNLLDVQSDFDENTQYKQIFDDKILPSESIYGCHDLDHWELVDELAERYFTLAQEYYNQAQASLIINEKEGVEALNDKLKKSFFIYQYATNIDLSAVSEVPIYSYLENFEQKALAGNKSVPQFKDMNKFSQDIIKLLIMKSCGTALKRGDAEILKKLVVKYDIKNEDFCHYLINSPARGVFLKIDLLITMLLAPKLIKEKFSNITQSLHAFLDKIHIKVRLESHINIFNPEDVESFYFLLKNPNNIKKKLEDFKQYNVMEIEKFLLTLHDKIKKRIQSQQKIVDFFISRRFCTLESLLLKAFDHNNLDLIIYLVKNHEVNINTILKQPDEIFFLKEKEGNFISHLILFMQKSKLRANIFNEFDFLFEENKFDPCTHHPYLGQSKDKLPNIDFWTQLAVSKALFNSQSQQEQWDNIYIKTCRLFFPIVKKLILNNINFPQSLFDIILVYTYPQYNEKSLAKPNLDYLNRFIGKSNIPELIKNELADDKNSSIPKTDNESTLIHYAKH